MPVPALPFFNITFQGCPMRIVRWVIAASAIVAGAFAAPATASVLFAAAPAAVNYVAVGDSFSSGNGGGSYADTSCYRSANGFPALYSKAAKVDSFTNAACSGAVTGDVINQQVRSLSASTTLVTITIGGNDAGFPATMRACTKGSGTGQDCYDGIAAGRNFIKNGAAAKLDATYAAIKKAAPNARLVVLGYPRLFERGGCSNAIWYVPLEARDGINAASDEINTVISARAKAAGADYVDVRSNFSGHGACGNSPWIREARILPSEQAESYHPTATGYRSGYLPALQGAVG
ncbi:SGNH/GDSL hydrolase family protein [Pseudonocardiaceae bacterium YIM PH 21723]|nr:SGNH/GDSL hydrolase family protein [Pseudonocardiaceae bacterium YIM PH 21723]